jgi:hypothetical protein
VDLTGAFEWYADWAADVSPLYERLARGVADDRVLLDIANEALEEQPAPQLLFAAVHPSYSAAGEATETTTRTIRG